MAIKIKAVERKLKFTKDENDPGVWRYVMQPDLYIALTQDKVIKEAALRSGVAKGVTQGDRPPVRLGLSDDGETDSCQTDNLTDGAANVLNSS